MYVELFTNLQYWKCIKLDTLGLNRVVHTHTHTHTLTHWLPLTYIKSKVVFSFSCTVSILEIRGFLLTTVILCVCVCVCAQFEISVKSKPLFNAAKNVFHSYLPILVWFPYHRTFLYWKMSLHELKSRRNDWNMFSILILKRLWAVMTFKATCTDILAPGHKDTMQDSLMRGIII